MEHSESLDKLGPALAKAQAEMGGAIKESTNPFFKSKYADLTSVWKACKGAFHNNGFSVIQSPVDRDGRIGVGTMLLHSSGQFVTGEYTLGVKKENNPQEDGSSITYARRYALAAFAGVCPEDDDGEKAMQRGGKPTATTTKPKGYTPNDLHSTGAPGNDPFTPTKDAPLLDAQLKAIRDILKREHGMNDDETNAFVRATYDVNIGKLTKSQAGALISNNKSLVSDYISKMVKE